MTNEINTIAHDLRVVHERIGDIRDILDTMMYGEDSENIPDEVYNHLRAAYDKVCEANDQLNKL